MRMRIIVAVWTALAGPVTAADPPPYAGQQERSIKAFSDEEITGYLSGQGMGMAKPAELNRYPGPRHVLDLAEDLQLSTAQVSGTRAIFARMQAQASALGAQLIEKERALDHAFAGGAVSATQLRELLDGIGALHAQLRYVHLNAHLEQRSLLSDQQVERYVHLRGYGEWPRADQLHVH